MSTRTVAVAMLVVALLLAGVMSFYASSRPDGLSHVAEDKGFARTEETHPGADGPLAGYDAAGVDDARLSGGLAGVTGVVVVLLLAGSLTLVLRRRRED
jgi:hypothetical protein